MTIDKIIEYAVNTPENTNPAVLRGMLKQLSGSGSGSGGELTEEEIEKILQSRIATDKEVENDVLSIL